MSAPDPLAEALEHPPSGHAMARECADLAREFPGWAITWTSRRGFMARRGDVETEPTPSRSALRCHLAQIEHRGMAR